MTDVEANPVLAEEPVEIDAFGLAPDWTSVVTGLGGGAPTTDHGYAFHTAYYPYGEGDVLATIRFEGLAATRGVLFLRVNAYPLATGVAYEVILRDIPMSVIAMQEGMATIRFTPRPGTRYAVLGHIYETSDATATGLSVRVEREARHEEEMRERISRSRSAFAAKGIRQVAHLKANDPPTLAHPVSQLCTAAQFDEPVYAIWAARLRPTGSPTDCWPAAYMLQALQTYGMLQAGALGLELGRPVDALSAVAAGAGCEVVVSDGTATELDGWRRPQICDDETFNRRVSLRPADRGTLLPSLVGFDFLWSQPDPEDFETVQAMSEFIFTAINCVKPGGLAVHVVPFVAEGNASNEVPAGPGAFRRVDLDRLALRMIGHGHEVAQLNHRGEPSGVPAPFGLIMRRGLRT